MYEIGDSEKGPVIALGRSPFRKRPIIGVRRGSVLSTYGYFRSEEDMAKFMEAMYEVFPIKPPPTEEE